MFVRKSGKLNEIFIITTTFEICFPVEDGHGEGGLVAHGGEDRTQENVHVFQSHNTSPRDTCNLILKLGTKKTPT
jgi:hypothetical protein